MGTVITTNLKHPLNSESKLSPHEVQVSYSYSASYLIVTMSHNSTSSKQLLLFLQRHQTSSLKLLYGFQQNFTGSNYLQMYNVPQPIGISCCYSLTTTRLPMYLIDLLIFNSPFSSSRDMTVQNLDFTRQTTDITHFAVVFHYDVISD